MIKFIRAIIFCIIASCISNTGIVYGANEYVMSINNGSTLCVANKILVNGNVVLESRCYNTSIITDGSYQMLINLTLPSTTSYSAGGITCIVQNETPNMNIQCGTSTAILFNKTITPST